MIERNSEELTPIAALHASLVSHPLLGFDTVSQARDGRCAGTKPAFVGAAAPFGLCYCSGTRISTLRNGTETNVRVEDLTVGDLAVTASGAHRPIRWIGQHTQDPRCHPRPQAVQPVRIAAGALGENRPARDLVVSPGHAICLDVLGEVLIPASVLVNGTTITQDELETVTYWHVELDSHDILIAEGQPAESCLDMGNRAFFADSSADVPDAPPDADRCRPFHDGGTIVDVARAQLRLRAKALGWKLTKPNTWTDVHLEVDGRIVEPKARELSACFMLPADAQDVWLVSPTGVPSEIFDSPDERTLGLCLSGLSLDDGLGAVKTVALDDPLLLQGFHAPASGLRWTAGRAQLPPALLQDMQGDVWLRVDLFTPALPRWVAPKVRTDRDVGTPDGELPRAA